MSTKPRFPTPFKTPTDNVPRELLSQFRDDDELAAIDQARRSEQQQRKAEAAAPPAQTPSDEEPLRYKRTTGSYTKPYVKKDGVTLMTKWGLHVPVSFVQQFKWFTGHLGLNESASDFVVKAVREKMRREIARRKQLGTWQTYEGIDDVG